MNRHNIQAAVERNLIDFNFLNSLREIGYQGLRFSEADWTKTELRAIQEACEWAEISLHHDNRDTNLCLGSIEIVQRAKNSVDKASKLNAKRILFHPGKYLVGNYLSARESFLKNLLLLLEYCNKHKISLILENNWENLVYDKAGIKITEYRKDKKTNIMGSEPDFFDFLKSRIGDNLRINFDFSHLILQGEIESIRNKIKNKEFTLGDESYVAYLSSRDLIDSIKRFADNFLKKFCPNIFVVDVNETNLYDDVNFIPGDGVGLSKYVILKLKKHGYKGDYLIEFGSGKTEFIQKYKGISQLELYRKSYKFLYTLLNE